MAPVRKRHPSAGGYARGEETRARIVEAALRVFGEEGYVRASTRRIAEEAGVRPPALQYYFDSKEGLHLACAERIIEHARPLAQALAQARARVDVEGAGAAMAALCSVLDALVDLSVEHKANLGNARFVARAQADGEGPALPVIRDRLVRPFQESITRLVGAILGADPDDTAVRLRASVIMAQASAFGVGRENTLRLLGWSDFDGARREAIKAVLRAHTRAALTGPAPPLASDDGPGPSEV